jgi:hypothetical protein
MFTPIYADKDYCLQEFLDNTSKFTYKNKKHIIIDNSNDNGVYYNKLKVICEPYSIEVYHVERGNNSREALSRAQNLARKIFLEGDYDFLFSLESDIFPKPNVLDALVSHNLDIITGLYFLGSEEEGTRIPCITVLRKNPKTNTMGSRLLTWEEVPEYIGKGVKEVMAGGMGCCLMYRKVIEKIKFTYIPGMKGHSDVYFFNDAWRLGYIVAVDTDMYCDHKNSDWTKVKDR